MEAIRLFGGRFITVNQAGECFAGIASGINHSGMLMLQDSEGTLHELSAGETSLSPLLS